MKRLMLFAWAVGAILIDGTAPHVPAESLPQATLGRPTRQGTPERGLGKGGRRAWPSVRSERRMPRHLRPAAGDAGWAERVAFPAARQLPLHPPLRMPAEFERQEFLFLSCGELTPNHADTIAEIAQAARRDIRVVVLCLDDFQQATVGEALRQRLDSLENITVMGLPHDTKWIRDYGPTLLRSGSRFRVIDWLYEPGRPNDEHVPRHLANQSETEYDLASIVVAGGNLLSNGRGLCLTTMELLHCNAHLGVTKADLRKQLCERINARELVLLEPLAGEGTGHVDMFATFTGPNTVVVGQYAPDEDEENAAILDRNAARLAAVKTPFGRLKVERIPMGLNHDGIWRTYTNCIYANRVLLVPSYGENDEHRLGQALELYRRLLPRWQVVPIDASSLIEDGGALHCISLNVPGLARPLRSVPLPLIPAEHGLPELGVRLSDTEPRTGEAAADAAAEVRRKLRARP